MRIPGPEFLNPADLIAFVQTSSIFCFLHCSGTLRMILVIIGRGTQVYR
jgi:hypothetical protein